MSAFSSLKALEGLDFNNCTDDVAQSYEGKTEKKMSYALDKAAALSKCQIIATYITQTNVSVNLFSTELCYYNFSSAGFSTFYGFN